MQTVDVIQYMMFWFDLKHYPIYEEIAEIKVHLIQRKKRRLIKVQNKALNPDYLTTIIKKVSSWKQLVREINNNDKKCTS